jgi:hypothetical protein
MVRTPHLLLALALLGVFLPVPKGYAQTPELPPRATTPAPADTPEPDILRTLPRPPDEPRSLLLPAPPPGPHAPPLPGPYFEQDPVLDPPTLPPLGLFAGLNLDVLKAHVQNKLSNQIQVGPHPLINPLIGDTVQTASAPLDWTVAPRFELGYRLPAGFGEVTLAYRFLTSQGTAEGLSSDGSATIKSRLDMNIIDLDYISREFSLWPHWHMKWRAGVRYAYIYFDSRADEPLAEAEAGTGVLEQRTSNSLWGVGPHAGLELARALPVNGLYFTGRVEYASLLGRFRQGFFETSAPMGPHHTTFTGETRDSSGENVPLINGQVGLTWQPYQDTFLFVGYQYEQWWNVGRAANLDSRAELFDQGLVLRAELNF